MAFVHSAKKRLNHLDMSERGVSDMHQYGQDMDTKVAFCLKTEYASHKAALLGLNTFLLAKEMSK